MKFPRTPPKALDLFTDISKKNPQRIGPIMQGSSIVDAKGRYLHWDEFKFKRSSEGLSPEEAWVATRMARMMASQSLPLETESGEAFTFCEPPSLRASLRNLDMNAGGSLASDVTTLSSGDGRLYLARSLAEEPFASSLIEGAATTRQIAKQLIFEGRSPLTKDERMVLNNYKALEFVKSHKDEVLTLDFLLELHRIVTLDTLDKNSDAGRIRTANDVRVVDAQTNDILHQPPNHRVLVKRLQVLINFANRSLSSGEWVHPLCRAVLLHFMIGYEHPFVDGNGRVARALFYWSALRDGYWLMEYVSISSVIAEAKIQYGKSYLHTETDDGDTTYFLIYNMIILEKAISRLGEYVNRRRLELGTFERKLSDSHLFNHRQSWLLNEFARSRASAITIAEQQERHSVSYLTARSDLENLVELGFLKKGKRGRISAYAPVRDLTRRLTAARA